DVLLLDRGAEPCRLDLVALDACILEAFLARFDHHVLGVAVPALAEVRAAHAEDDDFVADSGCHCWTPFAAPGARPAQPSKSIARSHAPHRAPSCGPSA